MLQLLHHASWMSSFLPAIAAVFHFKKTHPSFYPFLVVLWLGIFNELLTLVFVKFTGNNGLNGNVYVLLEGLLILWLFKNWGRLQGKIINFQTLLLVFIGTWVTDNFLLSNIYTSNSIYRFAYSFIIVFLSLHQMNFVIVRERSTILKNASFLICLSFVIFFTYKAIIEVFFVSDAGLSKTFYGRLFHILQFVNLLCNILYTIAVLWIQKRLKFILPY
ncbi:hypothetical protein [Aridibaculum aurantiacum]|uniref:hypothetical protein n=1 Tax=Aridibaculum aurantiacum TaxID=2810307 RepID=UPI001A969B45|nr:hypothetical protein [Aridibaculum aurantiacum]